MEIAKLLKAHGKMYDLALDLRSAEPKTKVKACLGVIDLGLANSDSVVSTVEATVSKVEAMMDSENYYDVMIP